MNTFKAVKESLPIEDYTRTLTELKPNGLRLVGCCPLPGHDDRTPVARMIVARREGVR